MAGNRTIECIGPSYMLADRKSAVQRAVNLFLTQIEGVGEDRQLILRSAPGITSYITASAVIRNMYNADGRWFVVSGDTLYEVVSGALTFRGTLISSSGYVGMRHGEDQLVLVDGTNGYVLRLVDNTFTRITSTNWRGSTDVDYLDGYFIFIAPDTEQFYISAIDDATLLDALDFSSADSQPDNIIAVRVFKRDLYLFGTRTAEPWVDAGGADFPFVRYNATPIQVGAVSKRAVIIAADSIVFVGATDRGRGYVYQMMGYQPVRISTQAVEEAINAVGVDFSSCRMWTYHVEGNEFIAVEADGMSTTWVYDASTKQWHERAQWLSGDWDVLGLDFVTYVNGEHYAASGSTIVRLDSSSNVLLSGPLVRERTWPHLISPSFEPINYAGLELNVMTGYGGNITLEISNDGGFVYGSPLQRSLGAIGRYAQRIRWVGLGSANDRVFRLRVSDDVPFSIYGAAVEAA